MILTPATQRRLSRRAGFTLLEVLVVVAILVILSTVAIVATTRYLEDARKGRAQLQCRSLSTAIEAYRTNAANPTFEEPTDLGQLLQPPFGGTSFLKNGQEDLYDPWGNQYQMRPFPQGDGTTIIQVYTRSKNDNTAISQFGIGPLAKVD